MKSTLLGGVATIAMFAAAGGLTPVAAQEPFDWTGFYIGGHVGYGEADYDGGRDLESDPFLADDLDLHDLAYGGHVGFNYQFDQSVGGEGNLVVGIEGDVTFIDWNDSNLADTEPPPEEGIFGDVDLLASIRARLGIAVDRSLVYVTGGIAIPDADYTVAEEISGSPDFIAFGSIDFDDIGVVVGGGIEFAATDWLSVRLEGLYYIFDDRHDTRGIIADTLVTDDFIEFDDAFVVRAGVSIHLGGLLGAM